MKISRQALYGSIFTIALVSLLGSLYYSEIEQLQPCLLCWYQRVLMYPIVPIALVGMLRRDAGLPLYVLPLSVLGIALSGYHYNLQLRTLLQPISDAAGAGVAAPCIPGGASCSAIDVVYFGFITIPLLSFLAFAAISAAAILCVSRARRR